MTMFVSGADWVVCATRCVAAECGSLHCSLRVALMLWGTHARGYGSRPWTEAPLECWFSPSIKIHVCVNTSGVTSWGERRCTGLSALIIKFQLLYVCMYASEFKCVCVCVKSLASRLSCPCLEVSSLCITTYLYFNSFNSLLRNVITPTPRRIASALLSDSKVPVVQFKGADSRNSGADSRNSRKLIDGDSNERNLCV